MIEDSILTKRKFAKLVEATVKNKGISHIDAVLEICESKGIDPGDISTLISRPLREKIASEAVSANMIRGLKFNSLPIWE